MKALLVALPMKRWPPAGGFPQRWWHGMEPPPDPAPLGVVDDATVRGAKRGDPEALDALLRQVAPYAGRICGAIALEEGEDALQETLIAIARGLPSLREPGAFRAWARRIAVREALRAARRRRPTEAFDDGAVADEVDIDTVADVRAALTHLRPEQRAVLVLRDLDGYSERDVATLLDVPEGTVKSRLHRARAAFARRWHR
jgi:RNA polymerase sigma factor (sigma-70 family)